MIRIFVPGFARPQGSKRHVGNGVMIESSASLRPWRSAVQLAASDAMGDAPPIQGPVRVEADFRFPRPKSHYRGDVLKSNAPCYASNRKAGDVDKLLRAVFDAMTAVAFEDDSQVVSVVATKCYVLEGEQPGVTLRVSAHPHDTREVRT